MQLAELAKLMEQFVEHKGWYQADSPKPQTPRNLALSLSLEAGELLEHFQWGEELNDPAGLASEMADVALYLLQLANVTQIDLEQAILTKLEQNQFREWPAS